MRLFTRIAQCSRANPFVFVFTCIPLCFTEPAPQFKESEHYVRERERCHCLLSVYIAISCLSNRGVLSERKPVCYSFYCFFTPHSPTCTLPLCHVMTQWHCICICMPLIAVIWTGRDVRLYMYCVYTYIQEHIYPHHILIIELPALFLPSSPSIPVQFRASFCILLSSFWAMLFAFAALLYDRQHFWLTLRPSLCRCCFYWA